MFLFYIVWKICYDKQQEVNTMRKEKVEVNQCDFPARLHWLFEGAEVYDSSSHSGATVLFLDTGYYLKTDEKGKLTEEAARAKFFHGLGLGVEVIDYLSEDRDYLATRMAEGEDLTHYRQDPARLCREYAKALRLLHSCPVEDIGLSPALQRYLDIVPSEESNGWARISCFPIASREEAWTMIEKDRKRLKADTLIHGDACLPNVLLKDWEFSAFIDFGQAGAGDRHIDLFWALWSLEYNLKTDAWTDYFLDCYGRENFDLEMLRVAAAFEYLG